MSSCSCLRNFIKMEWNVPARSLYVRLFPTAAAILSRISPAALLVNVSARISSGFTPWAIRFAILQVRTLVFPLPAPAMIRHGPSMFSTALACALFNPSKIASFFSSIAGQN